MKRKLHDSPSPRSRVETAIRHEEPDRVPVDFLATAEVWGKLIDHFTPDTEGVGMTEFLDPSREAVLRNLQVDCRLLSYDMFYRPPESVLNKGARVDWWRSPNRSTPNRMWRQVNPDGTLNDMWGIHTRVETHEFGEYEGIATWPLKNARSTQDLENHPWPEPDWWDFSPILDVIRELEKHDSFSIRFRIGSVFEISWQLRGMEEFLMDLASDPSVPLYIMDRLTEIYVENTRRVLELAGDRLDMVYFYDDVATKDSLLISPVMWRKFIRPHHSKLVELAHSYDKRVMYHCDGSIYPLIPELIDLGIDILNPIQPDAANMQPSRLKAEFGDKLVFHGGVDIINTLPRGTPDDVRAGVRELVDVLGKGGGFILCSSHHIQPDTPLENVLAMYEPQLRYRNAS